MFNKTRHGYTGTHARTQGLVKGKLIVSDDLQKHLKQSLFEEGGEYEPVARYGSEPPDPGLDVSIPYCLNMTLPCISRIGFHNHAGSQ